MYIKTKKSNNFTHKPHKTCKGIRFLEYFGGVTKSSLITRITEENLNGLAEKMMQRSQLSYSFTSDRCPNPEGKFPPKELELKFLH